jgi:predicted XRE-type DNA-binding protein
LARRRRVEILPELPERLRAAGRAVRDAKQTLAAEQERRDRVIVQAIDEGGMSQHLVAELVGLAQPSIPRILAESQHPLTGAPSTG